MIILVKMEEKYKAQLTEMLDEWCSVETADEITPMAIAKRDYHDFEMYLRELEVKEENARDGLVPDSVFFALDTEKNRFVGAVNIRHRLNERLLQQGGHIGDGVRPSMRKQGIGTEIVKLALEECRKMGITRVLMVCEKDNIASARTIQKNGGILENELEIEGEILQRYWITLED